jgi:hypothetical protein
MKDSCKCGKHPLIDEDSFDMLISEFGMFGKITSMHTKATCRTCGQVYETELKQKKDI